MTTKPPVPAEPTDDALMRLSQFAHTAAHMSEHDMRNNLSTIADELIALALRPATGGTAQAATLQRYRMSRQFHSMNRDDEGPYVQYDDVVALLAGGTAQAAEPAEPSPTTADADDEPANNCNVCGRPVRYGERHHQCGSAVMAAEKEASTLLTALDRLVAACNAAATFSNGVTDPTGTIDEGGVYGWEAVRHAESVIAKTCFEHKQPMADAIAAGEPSDFEALIELQARIGDAHENHGRNDERTMSARRAFHDALRTALAYRPRTA